MCIFENTIPAINHALHVKNKSGEQIVLEVSQHIGGGQVRAVSMHTTDELVRGQEVVDSGEDIMVPVGKAVLGRMFRCHRQADRR
jgi:F-type H+-transporting ATPase subunit beta